MAKKKSSKADEKKVAAESAPEAEDKMVSTSERELDDLRAANEHNNRIMSKQAEVQRLEKKLEPLESQVKEIKAELKEAVAARDEVIRAGKDPQQMLRFEDSKDPNSPESKPETSSDKVDWRSTPISKIKIPKGRMDSLKAVPIETLGDWDDLCTGRITGWEEGPEKLEGWGESFITSFHAKVAKLKPPADPAEGAEPNVDATQGPADGDANTETPDEADEVAEPVSSDTEPEADRPPNGTKVIVKVLSADQKMIEAGIENGSEVEAEVHGPMVKYDLGDNDLVTLMPGEFELVQAEELAEA